MDNRGSGDNHGNGDGAGNTAVAQPWWAVAALESAARYPGIRLDPAESERAVAYAHGRPRDDFVAGRMLARVLAAELLNRAWPGEPTGPGALDLAQHCPHCGADGHGTPLLRVPGRGQTFRLSYARASGWLLLALAPGNTRIGADLADLSDPAFASTGGGRLLEDYAYGPAERKVLARLDPDSRLRRQAEWWTLKEAVAKADGEGLAGAGGIPVVIGRKRHALLAMPKTRMLGIGPGERDSLGTALPARLVGSIVWVPPPAG
ncbi:4'-phosphopantetheinyl transferase family protein [Paeniglutamicibacter kerguelensis]|uniref:4'-phosphopantetheinyl transferase n=1 Tax=Paeniglutamicibacter kerguelensis TaxID=254788 RepID=A0ABS4X9W4_9MICC|nr:4'-phosphopantetheinyl transferase superfamily protein [Paeniglutamicibacter kerguelensis]MBP2385259.1 4'-phosphopantetheinyl transferase [Paeniglutamicibacter kerguelensis]